MIKNPANRMSPRPRKKSKLREKSARFTMPSEAKRKKDFQEYLNQIGTLNVETARAQRFLMLMREWFSDARPRFVEEYLRGLEKYVQVKSKDLIIAGHVDALYGNVVVEFEGALPKKLAEAKEQLRRYVYCLVSSKETRETNFICIAADGVRFNVYTPRWKDPSTLPESAEDVELRELDKIDFSEIDATTAFFWLDRYFFRSHLLHPTTEEFVRDFGISSPAYSFAIKLLESEWRKVGGRTEFKIIYENWEKYLRIAYGTSVAETELFLRHTYLAVFAKLLAYMRLAEKSTTPSPSEIAGIYTGEFFKDIGIQNFLEEDFLTWVARDAVRSTLVQLTLRIATLLERYYLTEISEDVLKSLYQELVDPETRHALGEFYTPDWLADRMVQRVLKADPRASCLDPACGSGTFLYFAIQHKRSQLGDSVETLHHIRDSVVGIDIHPLAVTIAKTNYLLALGELVKRRLRDFHIPVYMANSIKLPERTGQMTTEEKVLSFRVELDDQEVPIPEVFTEYPATFDEAVETCERFAKENVALDLELDRFKKVARKAISSINTDDLTVEVLFNLTSRMHELMRKERNSIWAFILKNVYRPIFLKRKFDWIIGNPPWLTYKDVERGTYQEFLKSLILKSYCLLSKGHLITHMELGTLFFCACLYEFAKPGGGVAFVLPRSVFSADQHDAFRKTSFGKAIHQTGLTEVWDLEEVAPLFKVPACVVFGKRPHHTRKPIPAEVLGGHLRRRNTPLLEAVNHLNVRSTTLHVVQQGERSFWSEDRNAKLHGKASPYGSKFLQGATIFPRSAWFVEIQTKGRLGFDPSRPYVRTDQRATDEAKDAYKDLVVEGNVEKEFLYATLLSTDLLPFGFLDFRPVVLPIKPSGDHYILVSEERADREGYKDLSSWLETVEREWRYRRKESNKDISSLQWVDYRRKLTMQSRQAKYIVLYPTSATNLCGTIVENGKIVKAIDGQRVVLQQFIIESMTYGYGTEDMNEAYFLAAILNSRTVDDLLKPMQARGLWGPRHIHKKVWELPIPAFDGSTNGHCELAELGRVCTEKVKTFLPELDTKSITPGKIGRLRNDVRERLKEELKEIDVMVQLVLKSR